MPSRPLDLQGPGKACPFVRCIQVPAFHQRAFRQPLRQGGLFFDGHFDRTAVLGARQAYLAKQSAPVAAPSPPSLEPAGKKTTLRRSERLMPDKNPRP